MLSLNTAFFFNANMGAVQCTWLEKRVCLDVAGHEILGRQGGGWVVGNGGVGKTSLTKMAGFCLQTQVN